MSLTPDTPQPEQTREQIFSRSPFLKTFLGPGAKQALVNRQAWEEELNQLSHPIQSQLENKFRTPHWYTLAVGALARPATNLRIFQDSASNKEIHQFIEWTIYAGFELGDYQWARNFQGDVATLLDSLGLLHPRTHITPGVRHDPPENIMMNDFIFSVLEAGAFFRKVAPMQFDESQISPN